MTKFQNAAMVPQCLPYGARPDGGRQRGVGDQRTPTIPRISALLPGLQETLIVLLFSLGLDLAGRQYLFRAPVLDRPAAPPLDIELVTDDCSEV
uniref:Uncharacterized protein n=1 Tax=Magnetospirillum gryphiswaldense TaxID=55518 RepID=A4U1D9_9PROT|nr:hypothetical protein MGR_3049 [Magnetospirillum gryphiswaldense MSR-1]